MSNLRWVERDGVRVLQYKFCESNSPNLSDWWHDVPTHQEPKKVTVAQELAIHLIGIIEKNRSYGSGFYEREVAKSAVEFFQKRMPKAVASPDWQKSEYGLGYAAALKSVKNCLFGEA